MPVPETTERLLATEFLHMAALSVAAVGLALGLVSRRADWVSMGVSMVLLLPPLRIAASVMDEAHARRFGVAAMGLVVLLVLFLSRHSS